MGILDTIMSMLGGGNSQSGQPSNAQSTSGGGNILGGLLGGGGLAGGLGGLVSQFENAGLGHIIQSWLGNGPNEPISPGQLGNVLGDDQVSSMAHQSGLSNNDFLSQLAQHLPGAVDKASPNGQIAQNDGGSVAV